MFIKAALNGSRSKADHPAIPITTDELVAAARNAVLAGANAIHFHVRDRDGKETLEAAFVNEQVKAVKAAVPDTPVGISTGAWIEPDISKRVELIRQWEILPNFVSVNGHEPGFEEVVQEILKKQIGVEAGLNSAQAVENFISKGLLKECFRLLIEPEEQELNIALATVKAIEDKLTDKLPHQTVVLHGVDNTCWEILKVAKYKGYDLRIGFEDTLHDPSGAIAESNEALVKAAFHWDL
ncbi:3-keto-5-aminohexanoate cleavage protein [Chitinophaga sp. OAE865]|uniref:3-keto-5-aminohexanoate cleavage protein n=1 Tax=Chitinophaga sp. OAE865 TaxID=2817898 RepID=UPI001AE679BF